MILKSFTVFYLVIHIFTNFFMTFGELPKVSSPVLNKDPPPPRLQQAPRLKNAH